MSLAKVLNKTVIFKTYIYDKIQLSYSTTTKIKKILHAQFDNCNLQLVFNSINSEKTDNQLECLDVFHVTTLNKKDGYITRNFIKSTAKDQFFSMAHHILHQYTTQLFLKKQSKFVTLLNVHPIT